MSKIFEDEFTDLQSGMISLCMEIAVQNTEKIFIYCSNEKNSKAFNAFFCVGGELKKLHQLGHPMSLMSDFLREGGLDVCKVDGICEKYNMPAPTEMKLYYDVRSRSFEAEYKYEEVCSGRMKLDSSDVFRAWFDKEQKKARANNKMGK